METSIIVVDDFYQNPLGVVEFMKSQEFLRNFGNHPGMRTVGDKNPDVKQSIQDLVYTAGGKITLWDEMEHTGAFNSCTSRDRSWVHADLQSWAGVVYLTPDAPSESGTGLYKHKRTGLRRLPKNPDGTRNEELLAEIYLDSQDMTKWEMTDYIGNRFNRLVLYRGELFHSAVNYFGHDFESSRFHQTFFFSTER